MTTVRIWFTKTGEASYISLLDLQRVMQRSLKRSGLPVWHTLGFNPHIYMTFSCPLPLGQESLVESVDVKTEAEVDFDAWQQALNKAMPRGIQVTRVTLPAHKAEEIGFAEYTLTMPLQFAAALEAYNALESAAVLKKTKRGHKTIELKEHMPAFAYTAENETLTCRLCLPAGEGLNLNPGLFLNFMQENCGLDSTRVNILRTQILLKNTEVFS